MTQNVKTWRLSLLRARNWSAILALAASVIAASSGCSSDDKPKADECVDASCRPVLSGRFTPCQTQDECDTGHGFSCVDGECSYECQQHSDCVEVGHCEARTFAGERRQFCVRDAKPPVAGELHTACPQGDECSDPRLCIGAGAGDLDAYCTVDCGSDDDCGVGYYCGTVTRRPCQAACGLEASPSDPLCVPPDQLGEGKLYDCNQLGGAERKVCRQREFCASCSTDADCLAVPNQVCAKDQTGEKICTRLCDTGTRSCPWGNASECAVFDEELGLPTCAHRFGSCHGSGKTCEPCNSSADCPNGFCTSSQFTGERWCVNLTTTCQCPTGSSNGFTCNDGGCPKSPDELTLQCVDDPTSSLNRVCYAANSGTNTLPGSSSQTGCWSPP